MACLHADGQYPPEQIRTFMDFMESKGFETLHRSQGYSNHRHLDPDVGRVDLVYVGGKTAARLFADTSHHETSSGLSIPVPRPEHLIAMKVLAMKNEFYHLQTWDVWMAEEYKFIWRQSGS